jgi:hypothetical protein
MKIARLLVVPLVASGLCLGGLQAASATSQTATHLSIKISAKWIKLGQRITLSARLTDATTGDPVAGQIIGLTFQEIDFIRTIERMTSSDGRASVTLRPQINESYRWTFGGSMAFGSSASDSRQVHVRQIVRIHSPAETRGAQAGHKILVWGTVAPGIFGQVAGGTHYVYIQGRTAKWHREVRVKLLRQRLPNGKTALGYVARFVPDASFLRAVSPGNPFNARGVSRTIAFPIVVP